MAMDDNQVLNLVQDSLVRRMRTMFSLYYEAVDTLSLDHVNHVEQEGPRARRPGAGMTQPTAEPAPTGLVRALTVVIGHSQRWGMVWFGLLFWGSVMNAVGTEAWPDANALAVGAVAAVVGLTGGLVAKVRGRWI